MEAHMHAASFYVKWEGEWSKPISNDVTKKFISHGGMRMVGDWMNPNVSRCDWFREYNGHVTVSVAICWICLLIK